MIRLQFVCGDSLSSRAIAWFGGGKYSHVDAVLPDGSLLGSRSDRILAPDGTMLEAGVQIRPAAYEKWKRRDVFTLPCSKYAESRWLGFLKAQRGKPYDSTAIWGFVVGRDWRESDAWYCSELQAAALEDCGVSPYLAFTPNKITPNDLALIVSGLGAKTPQLAA